jgi:hypothetical protein
MSDEAVFVVVNWTSRSTQRFPNLNEARAELSELLADGDDYTIFSMVEETGPGVATDRGVFAPNA